LKVKSTISELKQTTVQALESYRRMKARLLIYKGQSVRLSVKGQANAEKLFFITMHRPDIPVTEQEAAWLKGWVAAIDNARRMTRETYPDKARFMARCFGLDNPIPRKQSVEARITKLSIDLHAATSTLYKWREDILYLTMLGAIEAGVLRPFGLDQGSKPNSVVQSDGAGDASTATTSSEYGVGSGSGAGS